MFALTQCGLIASFLPYAVLLTQLIARRFPNADSPIGLGITALVLLAVSCSYSLLCHTSTYRVNISGGEVRVRQYWIGVCDEFQLVSVTGVHGRAWFMDYYARPLFVDDECIAAYFGEEFGVSPNAAISARQLYPPAPAGDD